MCQSCPDRPEQTPGSSVSEGFPRRAIRQAQQQALRSIPCASLSPACQQVTNCSDISIKLPTAKCSDRGFALSFRAETRRPLPAINCPSDGRMFCSKKGRFLHVCWFEHPSLPGTLQTDRGIAHESENLLSCGLSRTFSKVVLPRQGGWSQESVGESPFLPQASRTKAHVSRLQWTPLSGFLDVGDP